MKLVGKQAINGSLVGFRNAVENRKQLWSTADLKTRSIWVEKDPVMKKAYELYQYLETHFFRGYQDGK